MKADYYTLVTSRNDPHKLAESVCRLLSYGWELHGITMITTWKEKYDANMVDVVEYAQAMVRICEYCQVDY